MDYCEYPSPVGTLYLTADEGGLTGIWMHPVKTEDFPILSQAKAWLDGYFSGNPTEVTFPLNPQGTPFQKQVWEILLAIPYGKTTTYGAIAREMAQRTGKEKMSAQAVGQAVGANRRDMAKRFAWLCTAMGMGIMALTGVGLYVFAPQLMGIFTADAAVIALGARVLRIEAFAEPMFGASIVASGSMQGAGDSTGCFILNLVSMWGVRLTLAVLLAPRFGLVGVWAAMCAELCTRGALFLLRMARGKWLDKGALA